MRKVDIDNKEVDLINSVIKKLPYQQNQRIIIAMPPRCGKSELVSRRFPAWLLGQYPDHQIITASYSGDLAKLFNRDVQRIMEDDLYAEIFPDTIMGGTNAAKLLEENAGFNKAKRTASRENSCLSILRLKWKKAVTGYRKVEHVG